MTRPPAPALTTLALLTLSFGWSPGQTNASPPAAVDSSTKPQIESNLLRIEFDHNLHTRVVPLFAATKPLIPVLRLGNSARRNSHMHRLRANLRPNRADLRRLRPRPAPHRNRQRRHSTQEGRGHHLQRFPLDGSLRSRIHKPRHHTADDPRMVQQSLHASALPPPRPPPHSGPIKAAPTKSALTGSSPSTPDSISKTI